MLTSILIGIGGSPCDEAAIELGIRWSRRFDAALFGMGIVDPAAISGPEAVPLGGMAFKAHRDEARLDAERKIVERALRSFAAKCTDAGVPAGVLTGIGVSADQMTLEAQRYDLVLVGRHTGLPAEARANRSELLRNIVRGCPRPVIAVPEQPIDGTAIIVAYDGSLQAARTLQAFMGIGLGGAQRVHVVGVHRDSAEAARHVDRAVEYLRFHDVAAVPHVIGDGRDPSRVILQLVRELSGELLVMGAYGQSMLREFVFGSVTRAVLDECPVPVVLAH